MASPKKQKYAQARINGHNQSESAVIAGYSEGTARQAGSRLEKDPDVIAAKERLKKFAKPVAEKPDPVLEVQPVPEPSKAPDPEYQDPEPEIVQNVEPEPEESPNPILGIEDPLDVMRKLMNDLQEDPKLRLDAAKALASFTVAKPGEKGKKEQQGEKAKAAANKFRNLRSVK